ncbi:MAG: uridylate kinase, partial [Methanoregula sp.]|nr:uridylate kinase [Methanoregula sp.]
MMEKRFEITSGLQGETLVRKGLHRKQVTAAQIRITPDLNVIKIGGHAAIDYGREVMGPLIEELGELSKKHQMLI